MKKHLLVSLNAGFSNARVGESLGIRYIKSFLNTHGYEVDILENQFLKMCTKKLIHLINDYDVIGFSINYCGQIPVLKELLDYHFESGKIIYLGGHFASICYERLLKDFPMVDFIMLADGEYATLELVNKGFNYKNVSNIAYLIEGDVISNPIVLVEQLDDLPFPYRDKNSYYLGDKHFSIISSRGCYHNCSYCSVGSFTKAYFDHKIRLRSAKNIYEEIKQLIDVYNVKYFTFQDDLFIGTDLKSQERAKELAKMIIDGNLDIFFSIQCSAKSVNSEIFSLLYRAGLRNVMIGIENFSKHALQCFDKSQNILDIKAAIKILREIGIPISYGFIMYYPEMLPIEILENINILYGLGLINFRSITSKLQIYIGTPYCERKLDDLVDIERTNYTIKYQFKNIKLRNFIEACEALRRQYGHVERKLYRLEFLSHSNIQIDDISVAKFFSEFKDCLCILVKAKYFEIFQGRSNNDIDIVQQRITELEKEINNYVALLDIHEV